MSNKSLSIIGKISKIGLIFQEFAAYVTDVGEVKDQVQKALISIVALIIGGVTLVLCTWFSILALIFFALLMIPLTYLQAALVVVGVNVLIIIGLFVYFSKAKKKVKKIKISGAMVLINYCILVLKRHF